MIIFTDKSGVKRFCGKERMISIIVLAVALIILIVGIALIAVAATKKSDEKPTSTASPSTTTGGTAAPSVDRCKFSGEALRVGLPTFLSRVKAAYYKLHPYNVYYDPDVTTDRVKMEYVAYDPTPSTIKNRTDTAQALLKEIEDKGINADKLTPRERKALSQVKHYVQHIFGQPYDVNYYAGDWMLGPNLFCWQEICYHGYGVYNGLGTHHKPYNAKDVELIEQKLKTHKAGILQYIENMKMGVRRGMIRSVEECEAGINSFKRQYLNVSLHNETGKHHVLICCAIVVHNVPFFYRCAYVSCFSRFFEFRLKTRRNVLDYYYFFHLQKMLM